MAWEFDDSVTGACAQPGCANLTVVADVTIWAKGPLAGKITVTGFCDEHAWHGEGQIFTWRTRGTNELRYGLQIGVDTLSQLMEMSSE